MTDAPVAYAETGLERHRRHLRTLFEAFGRMTGYPPTTVSVIARGDTKWGFKFEQNDFTHSSYDTAVSRLSALWPDHIAWPAEVPRQAPAAEIPASIIETILRRRRVDGIKLPAGVAWPEPNAAPDGSPARGEDGNGEEAQG
jgi:hypothetical protein